MLNVKIIFAAANLMLVAALAYFGVDAFYNYLTARYEQSESAPVAAAVENRPTLEKKQPLAYYSSIVERNLFNTKSKAVDVKPAKESVNIEGLEQTKLNLKLYGTVIGLEGGDYAVIEEAAKRKQNLYRVGQSVDNATIKMILRERVVLSVNGKDEVLEIEKVKSGRGFKRAPAARSSVRTSPKPRTQRITLRRSQLEETLQNVNELMSQVNVRPHFQEGKPDGLMLSRIRPNSMFMRMGLRNGDIITGVNGQDIQSVDDALKFYESLKNADNVSVQLKRRGRERQIDYSIR
jgi:general secretion pathway protein C